MSILIDHCVPGRYKRLLQEWGCTAYRLTEHLAADTSDTDIIAFAKENDFVLLTVDKGFSNIIDYPPSNYTGIIVMRYKIDDETELDVSLKKP